MILGKKFIDCTECKDKMEKLSEKTDAEGLMQSAKYICTCGNEEEIVV